MSGVYQRNREVSEYKFFTQAIAIRVEVNKLMASSSVVPKAYRLLNAVPTVETARSIVYNVNRADCFYPNSSFNALERKRYLTLAIADWCGPWTRCTAACSEISRRGGCSMQAKQRDDSSGSKPSQ